MTGPAASRRRFLHTQIPTPAHEAERQSLVEGLYEAIKARIVDGRLAPGAKVLEAELALALGTSRTPVREALIRLQSEGFLEPAPRGLRVTPLSAQDIREINEVLACLEAEAAERLARRHPGPAEMALLDAAIATMDRALEGEDRAAWAEADYRFHRLIIELCGNRHLAQIARLFLDKAHRVRLLTTPLRERPVYANVNHAAVVEAVRRGDPQTALEIHRAHKRRWSAELEGLLRRLGLPG
ncbi:GntR family transcriptional regulator [Falsiroseomonas sp. HW251]|uniref:GntR family transcriptional regulator n=1 Tax=Falsiroseomonas sp. HW251 TaxID=3390998 RepID=UPI003D317D1C